MLRIGRRSHATVVQRVVERVLRFHHLFAGKSSWKIRVGYELRDMHHLYKGLWRFLHYGNFHYFAEGVPEVCHYLHVPWVKHEPKYTLIDFVEAAKAIEKWFGIETCSRLDSMALPSVDFCSNSKCRTYDSRKSALDNMREKWHISNSAHLCSFLRVAF